MKNNQSGLSFYKKKKRINSGVAFNIFSYVFLGIAMVLIAFVCVFCFGITTAVIGNSMQPTLNSGQTILIDRFIYNLSNPQYGDVVVFLPKGNENTNYYVKRVVAVPGDTVQIKNGWLYINGTIYEESDYYDKMEDGGIAATPITLGEGEYFVLGDNRNNSEDSRSGDVGIVLKDYIIGKAWFKLEAGNIGSGFIK